MIRRLRIKLICVTMAVAAVMLCVIFALTLHFTQTSLEMESLQVLEAAASDPFSPDRQNMTPYFIIQFWPGGVRLVTGGGYYGLSEELLPELVSGALESGESVGLLPEYNLRFKRLDPYAGQGFAFVDISGEASAMRHLVHSCLLIGAVSLAAFFLVSLALAHWAVRPVDEAWRQQRQFVADASHELKTPLTVILTNAELLQNCEGSAAAQTRFVKNILTTSRQMRGLVENLLDLARVDGGLTEKAVEVVDLSRLLSEALLPFEPVFFERGLPLESQIVEGIIVRGSELHLRQVVDILLDNARKYAQGPVEIRLDRSGSRWCLLFVASPGEEMSSQEIKDIFKRFYRRDKSRSQEGGAGLGLSIAQGIVEAHGGKIWAESRDSINIFYVRLPALHGRQ